MVHARQRRPIRHLPLLHWRLQEALLVLHARRCCSRRGGCHVPACVLELEVAVDAVIAAARVLAMRVAVGVGVVEGAGTRLLLVPRGFVVASVVLEIVIIDEKAVAVASAAAAGAGAVPPPQRRRVRHRRKRARHRAIVVGSVAVCGRRRQRSKRNPWRRLHLRCRRLGCLWSVDDKSAEAALVAVFGRVTAAAAARERRRPLRAHLNNAHPVPHRRPLRRRVAAASRHAWLGVVWHGRRPGSKHRGRRCQTSERLAEQHPARRIRHGRNIH